MKHYLYFFLALLAGCQPQRDKNKIPPAAVYDQSSISAFYEQAATDDQLFQGFKNHPVFNLVHENASYEQGAASLNVIAEKFPGLLAILDKLRSNDAIGSPRVYAYEKVGEFSPTTLHYVALCGKIQEKIGDLEEREVVQIGAGYGGLCNVLHQLHRFKSYTIVDTPASLKLAERYLAESGVDGVRFIAIKDLKQEIHSDLVISDGGFFESSKVSQDILFSKVAAHADCGFFFGRPMPKHVGVVPYSPKEIKKKLSKKGIEATIESEENFPSLSSFNLFWKKSSVSAENIHQ
ncbi:MAG: putative sugar O-methyltransferase [Verrucomicrobia bacterium]|nr:putative sugar O-methyltransferase [Verrucomicrobiota bacterium]